MKFERIHTDQINRFSIYVDKDSGQKFISIPVTNGLVDYMEDYKISKEEFEKFKIDEPFMLNFVHKCKTRQMDDRLLGRPSKNRGVAD